MAGLMYRRNISHILYTLAGLVAFFVIYETQIKPPPLAPLSSALIEERSPNTSKLLLERPSSEALDPSAGHSRLIDSSIVPDTTYQGILTDIRDDIARHNLKAAETKLSGLPSAMQSDAQVRPFLSVLWNNLGIEQEKHEGTKTSVKAFRKAAAFDGANPIVLMNLAHAYWEQRDPEMTTEFLERVASLAPNEPFPHIALADLFQGRDQLSEAALHLDKAAELAGSDPATQSYLQTVTAKVRHADQIEGKLISQSSPHFTVKYDGATDNDTWVVALEILEEAYREIGQTFGHFPAKPIVVVLHTNGTFQGATGSPVWADGLFDPVLGRIQIPTQGALTNRLWLKRVLRHEFVHALLHDQQGFKGSTLPTWLNEGLAMRLSSDRWSDIENLNRAQRPLIPLTALEGGWSTLSVDTALAAYFESESAVRYLVERYGMDEIRHLLARLKKNQPLTIAMESQLSLSYEQFQSSWIETFQNNSSPTTH
ncbi:peptidase MA family metallohydrolase [Petrachloros mirabilis]